MKLLSDLNLIITEGSFFHHLLGRVECEFERGGKPAVFQFHVEGTIKEKHYRYYPQLPDETVSKIHELEIEFIQAFYDTPEGEDVEPTEDEIRRCEGEIKTEIENKYNRIW